MFTKALGVPLALNKVVLVIAAYMISWAIGYVAPIPGGMGVREAALLLILGPVCGNGLTAVAMILHRIASIFGDVIAFLFELILARKAKKG
jgi:glycosyltransferase 2 family protein